MKTKATQAPNKPRDLFVEVLKPYSNELLHSKNCETTFKEQQRSV